MNLPNLLNSMNRLRWLVAFLGSKGHAGWWECSFMDATGIKFLANAFPRSADKAAFHATTEAAQRIHDSALGRVGHYHLFRFPLQVEDRFSELQPSENKITSHEDAMTELAEMAAAVVIAPEGPVQVGVENRILTDTSISELAAHYHSAFSQGIRCYPYFSAGAQ
jgi:hypothetical protein